MSRIMDCVNGKERCDACIQMDMIEELRRENFRLDKQLADNEAWAKRSWDKCVKPFSDRVRELEKKLFDLTAASDNLAKKVRACEPTIFQAYEIQTIQSGVIVVGPNYSDELKALEEKVKEIRVH